MSSEDENYVTVTVKARGMSAPSSAARQRWQRWGRTVSPAHRSTSAPSTRSRLGFSRKQPSRSCSLPGSAHGIPMDAMRIELVYAAVRCGFPEEEERSAIYYDLDIDMDGETAKEEKDE